MVVEVGVFEVLLVAQITVEVGLQIGKTRFFRLLLLFVLLQIIFSNYAMPNAFTELQLFSPLVVFVDGGITVTEFFIYIQNLCKLIIL